jgi:transcriptional regulator with XRE-family HTH domain
MTIGRRDKSEYRPPTKRFVVSVGESVRIIRELWHMSQNEFAAATRIPRSTISTIRNGRVNSGEERAKQFDRALKCHPADWDFHGWNLSSDAAA